LNWHGVVAVVKGNQLLFGLLTTAAIVTMPAPGSPFNWRTLYTWIYEGAHLFMNLRRPTLPAETPANPNPTTPPAK
jgi:hypothetical protein